MSPVFRSRQRRLRGWTAICGRSGRRGACRLCLRPREPIRLTPGEMTSLRCPMWFPTRPAPGPGIDRRGWCAVRHPTAGAGDPVTIRPGFRLAFCRRPGRGGLAVAPRVPLPGCVPALHAPGHCSTENRSSNDQTPGITSARRLMRKGMPRLLERDVAARRGKLDRWIGSGVIESRTGEPKIDALCDEGSRACIRQPSGPSRERGWSSAHSTCAEDTLSTPSGCSAGRRCLARTGSPPRHAVILKEESITMDRFAPERRYQDGRIDLSILNLVFVRLSLTGFRWRS